MNNSCTTNQNLFKDQQSTNRLPHGKRQIEEEAKANQSLMKNSKNAEQQTTLNVTSYSQMQQQEITVLFLSCDNDEKSFIFNKLHYPTDQEDFEEKAGFRRGKLLENKFVVIDCPYFNFLTDPDKTINLYQNYFCENRVHFIFFFIDYQRTDLMREQLNSMLKKLIKVDRQKMAIIVTNWQKRDENDDGNDFAAFIKARNINKLIRTCKDDSQDHLLNKFKNCLSDSNDTCLSFSQTVFAQETKEELDQAHNLSSQFQMLADNIKESKLIVEKERLKQLKNNEQYLNQEKDELEKELQKKLIQDNDLQKQIKSNQQLISKLEKLYYDLQELQQNIDNQGKQEKDLINKLFNLSDKCEEQQLVQAEERLINIEYDQQQLNDEQTKYFSKQENIIKDKKEELNQVKETQKKLTTDKKKLIKEIEQFEKQAEDSANQLQTITNNNQNQQIIYQVKQRLKKDQQDQQLLKAGICEQRKKISSKLSSIRLNNDDVHAGEKLVQLLEQENNHRYDSKKSDSKELLSLNIQQN